MTSLNAETVWQMPKKELISLIDSGAISNRTGKIRFYAPSFVHYKNKYFSSPHEAFPSISITGSSCALKCKHCNGRVLDTMVPSMTPEGLFDVCAKLKKDGAIGCLISGGCLPDGSVPIDKFIDAIAKIKQELGLIVVVHTGVIDLPTAKRLKSAGVDAALIDIIGSDETIREIYHLDVTVSDYEQSLQAFNESGIPFVPHVLVGLHYGKLKGEILDYWQFNVIRYRNTKLATINKEENKSLYGILTDHSRKAIILPVIDKENLKFGMHLIY